jgi:hypothetical protein
MITPLARPVNQRIGFEPWLYYGNGARRQACPAWPTPHNENRLNRQTACAAWSYDDQPSAL